MRYLRRNLRWVLHVHTYTYTIVSWMSARGWSSFQVCQRGGWELFWVFPHLTMKERPCHVLQRLNTLEANNWTNKYLQQNHQRLQSQVLTPYNTLNGTMSPWTWCSTTFSYVCLHKAALWLPSLKYCTEFLTSDVHSAWGYASQTQWVHSWSSLQGVCSFE